MKRDTNGSVKRTSVRCAIYTRKSTEEGLEQEFNSLDAQRESGEAYIKSQASESWVCLPDPAHVPAALRERPQWVCWKFIKRDGKPTKCPVNPRDGGRADSTDPSTWTSFDDAVAAWRASDRYAGVGFVFAPADPFTGIDLDGCIDDNGEIVAAAHEILESLNSYTEISPSGRGVKVFIIGAKPEGCGCKSKKISPVAWFAFWAAFHATIPTQISRQILAHMALHSIQPLALIASLGTPPLCRQPENRLECCRHEGRCAH